MLAEARGYHFGLTLAHQNLAQMPRETQQAISGLQSQVSQLSASAAAWGMRAEDSPTPDRLLEILEKQERAAAA